MGKPPECQKQDNPESDHSVLVDRLYNELVSFFDDWENKVGNGRITTSTWFVVGQAVIAAHRMKLAPEVEQVVITEAVLQFVKRLGGDDAVATDRAAGDIPLFYDIFKPACHLLPESHFGMDSGQGSDPTGGSSSSAPIIGPEDVPGLSLLIQLMDTAMENIMIRPNSSEEHGDGGSGKVNTCGNKDSKSSEDKGNSSANCSCENGETKTKTKSSDDDNCNSGDSSGGKFRCIWKWFVNLAPYIGPAFVYISERVATCYPKLGLILGKIGAILVNPTVILPMLASVPPLIGWILGGAAILVVGIGVAVYFWRKRKNRENQELKV